MPDTTPTPSTTTVTTPKVTRQPPGDIDRKILADMKLGEDIAEAAADAQHASDLETREEVTAAQVNTLKTLANAARDLAGQLVSARKARNSATEAETLAMDKLMARLRDIQQRAKGKCGDEAKRAAYCINKANFGRDRDGLQQDAKNIIDLGEADALRGLTADKIAAARAALDSWNTADDDQRKADEKQGNLLKDLREKVDEVKAARREIQLAADTCWPHTDGANAPVRRAFKIPATKPVTR